MRVVITIVLILGVAVSGHAQFWKGKDDKQKSENSSGKKEKRNKAELNSMFSTIYDVDLLSSYFGANHLLADHQAVIRLENRYIPSKLFRKDNTGAKVGNAFYRLGKTFLLDYILNYSTYQAQRQVFGSKYRLEENGAIETSVNINLPAPFSGAGSSVSAIIPDSISPYQRALNLAGAMEGSSVLADMSRKNMLINPDFAYEEAFLYLFSNNDLAAHIGLISDTEFNPVYEYVDQINSIYTNANLSVDDLKLLSYLDMVVDPMNIAAVASIGRYIVKGETLTDLIWLKFGENVKWLPSLKMQLAPFGPELNYQNFLKINRSMFELDFRHLVGGYAQSIGVDLKAFNLLFGEKKKLAIDGIASVWDQPEITFKDGSTFDSFSGIGGSGEVRVNYRIFKKRNAYVQCVLGYKSKGFQEGTSLDADFIFRAGFAFR